MATYNEVFSGSANPIGGVWTTAPLLTAMKKTSGLVTGTAAGTDCGAYYNGAAFDADQSSEVRIGPIGDGAGCLVRVNASGCYVLSSADGTQVVLYKVTSGPTFTQIGTWNVTLANGDYLKLTATGANPTTFAAAANSVDLGAVASGSNSDASSPYTSGSAGIYGFDTTFGVTEVNLTGVQSAGPGAGSDSSMVGVSESTTNRITVRIIEETS